MAQTRQQDRIRARTGPGEYRTVILGAGMSGIAAAIRLMDDGHDDFVVLEKNEGVGGTWRVNTYPGCACDVPSSLYSYSFAPKSDWSRTYGQQPEILAYLQDTATRFGVVPRIAFGSEATHIQWDTEGGRWTIDTPQGRYIARALIGATGPINEPSIPDVDGMDSFAGEVFHSARWNHDIDLTGKRVAVIGNGASAIQFVPQIQPKLGHLYLFQRTPQWVLPFTDTPIATSVQRLFRAAPSTQRAHRAFYANVFEWVNIGLHHPNVMRRLQSAARWQLRRQVKDPQLRAALTPLAILGCKRILSSNKWYPAITAANATLVPHALARIQGSAVIAADGSSRDVDVIIFATGFDVANPPILEKLVGRDGRSLAEVWAGTPQAYLGTTISGFPNFFQMLGPNAISQTSCMDLVEAQLNYVIQALRHIGEHGIIEVRPEVQAAHQEALHIALAGSVWSDGNCHSYYLDGAGRNFGSWPWKIAEFKRRLSEFDRSSYTYERARTGSPA